MTLSVLGTGYLGITHAVCMASCGHDVLGLDRDHSVVRALAAGYVPLYEPGLEALLSEHLASGRLAFTCDYSEVARHADVHFITVGTPQKAEGRGADISAVQDVVRSLVPHLVGEHIIVGKSTVPPGTAAAVQEMADALAASKAQVTVLWNPEFLREGHAIADTLHPDRIVLGSRVPGGATEQRIRALYQPIIDAGVPVISTDWATAELAKYASNAFLATKISFINAMHELALSAGADITTLADIMGSDPRIGRDFLNAGPGYGGGCLPKDLRALQDYASTVHASSVSALLHSVELVNEQARLRVINDAITMLDGTVRGKKIAILGCAFKPGSDDVRSSPALSIAKELHTRGARLSIWDPHAIHNARTIIPDAHYCTTIEKALTNAELTILGTPCPELLHLNPQHAAHYVKNQLLLDPYRTLPAAVWLHTHWTIKN